MLTCAFHVQVVHNNGQVRRLPAGWAWLKSPSLPPRTELYMSVYTDSLNYAISKGRECPTEDECTLFAAQPGFACCMSTLLARSPFTTMWTLTVETSDFSRLRPGETVFETNGERWTGQWYWANERRNSPSAEASIGEKVIPAGDKVSAICRRKP